MEHLCQQSYALCGIYTSLCKNQLPSEDTRSAIRDVEGWLSDLASQIATLKPKADEPQPVSNPGDDIPF